MIFTGFAAKPFSIESVFRIWENPEAEPLIDETTIIYPESVIRIRGRLFRADETRNARRVFAVGAGLPRPKC
jgi:hypothetical protein